MRQRAEEDCVKIGVPPQSTDEPLVSAAPAVPSASASTAVAATAFRSTASEREVGFTAAAAFAASSVNAAMMAPGAAAAPPLIGGSAMPLTAAGAVAAAAAANAEEDAADAVGGVDPAQPKAQQELGATRLGSTYVRRRPRTAFGSVRCSSCNCFGVTSDCCAGAKYYVVLRSKSLMKEVRNSLSKMAFNTFAEANSVRHWMHSCALRTQREQQQHRRTQRELQQRKMQERTMRRQGLQFQQFHPQQLQYQREVVVQVPHRVPHPSLALPQRQQLQPQRAAILAATQAAAAVAAVGSGDTAAMAQVQPLLPPAKRMRVVGAGAAPWTTVPSFPPQPPMLPIAAQAAGVAVAAAAPTIPHNPQQQQQQKQPRTLGSVPYGASAGAPGGAHGVPSHLVAAPLVKQQHQRELAMLQLMSQQQQQHQLQLHLMMMPNQFAWYEQNMQMRPPQFMQLLQQQQQQQQQQQLLYRQHEMYQLRQMQQQQVVAAAPSAPSAPASATQLKLASIEPGRDAVIGMFTSGAKAAQ